MRSLATVLVCFMIASVAIDESRAAYGRINEYLISHVDNDEIGPNMAAASKWLKELAGSKPKFLKLTPINDLKQFTALQQVVEDTKCDGSVSEIMRANANEVDLYRLKDNGLVNRRVDKVILEALKQHAKQCQQVYLGVFDTKRPKLDNEMLERVEELARTVFAASPLRFRGSYWVAPPMTSDDLFQGYIRQRLNLRSFAAKNLVYRAVEDIASRDPEVKYLRRVGDEHSGKLVVHKDKIKQLTRKYVLEPCKQYEAEMGPGLFDPVLQDAKTYIKVRAEERDFFLYLAYYTICKALTSDEAEAYNQVIDKVY